jgi:hypothetical protein
VTRLRGLWILLIGILVMFASDFAYKRRSSIEHVEQSKTGWHFFIEPSELEEGAIWAGVLSAALGCTLLVLDLARTSRRRIQ